MLRRKLLIALALICALLLTASFAARGIVGERLNRVHVRPPYPLNAEGAELRQKLFIADMHCDALLWGRNLLKRSTSGHVDIPRLQEAHVSLQAFTVVSTAPFKLNIQRNSGSSDMIRYLAILDGWPPRTWNSPKERALYQASRLRGFEADSNGAIVILRHRGDLQRIAASPQSGVVAALLGAEGAQPLEGRIENLDALYDAGYRMMAPTHFTDTEIGGSASGLHKGGLTELGRKWVRAMEARHMLIDLAHASPATLRDVAAIAARPLVVSHTGVKGVCNNSRNLSDDELRAVARTGGVVGIGYWSVAVCGTDVEAIARAIEYTAKVIGAEHVGLGSDFDGAVTAPFDTTGVPMIADALRKDGVSEHDIRLIMGENVRRVLEQVLPE